MQISDKLDGLQIYDHIDVIEEEPSNGKYTASLVIKYDIPDIPSFDRILGGWKNSDESYDYFRNKIYLLDGNTLMDKKINLELITYKDSIFNERPCMVVTLRYNQIK